MSFALYNLAAYPDVQEKARQEALRVLGSEPADIRPTAEQCKEFKYIDMVIKEVTATGYPACLNMLFDDLIFRIFDYMVLLDKLLLEKQLKTYSLAIYLFQRAPMSPLTWTRSIVILIFGKILNDSTPKGSQITEKAKPMRDLHGSPSAMVVVNASV